MTPATPQFRDRQFDLLVHESEQVQENIQGCLAEMRGLVALGFPVLTGAFAYASGTSAIDEKLLNALFVILLGLLVVLFNVAWMQMLAFVEYKYVVLANALRDATGSRHASFGAYAARGGLLRSMAGPAILQAIVLGVAISRLGAPLSPTLTNAVYLVIAFAILTTFFSWGAASKGTKAVRNLGRVP